MSDHIIINSASAPIAINVLGSSVLVNPDQPLNISVEAAPIAVQIEASPINVVVSGAQGPVGLVFDYLWVSFLHSWTSPPTINPTIPVLGGKVYDYVYGLTTYYRHVPSPYDSSADAFYSSFSSGILSGILAVRSQPIAP